MQLRAAVIATLSFFACLGTSLPLLAQDLSAQGTPTLRVEAASNASPSPQSVQSPVLGFVSSAPLPPLRGRSRSTSRVRAILGVPGAATLSIPLVFPEGVRALRFAPGQNYALAEMPGGVLAVLPFRGEQVGSPVPLPGAISSPDIVAFSPGASAAAFFSAGQSRLVIITGLPGSPQLSRDLTGADLPENVQKLALANDGSTVLASTGDGAVFVLRPGGAPELVYMAGSSSAVAFAPGSMDAVVFDGSGSKAVLIQNAASAPAPRLLAQGLPALTGTVLLQVELGDAILGAVGATELYRINLQTLQVDQLALPAPLTTLQPLRTAHRFLISAEPDRPAWVLDTTGPAMQASFVPQQTGTVFDGSGGGRR